MVALDDTLADIDLNCHSSVLMSKMSPKNLFNAVDISMLSLRWMGLDRLLLVAVIWSLLRLSLLVRPASSCYVYPADLKDPCREKKCSFGAHCAPSIDGLTARCQCQVQCDTYGDNVGSRHLCASDGRDYNNACHMRRIACRDMTDIHKKFDGKCGKKR